MTNDLMARLNIKGKGEKEGFGNTLLCNIVTGKHNNIAFCTCTNLIAL